MDATARVARLFTRHLKEDGTTAPMTYQIPVDEDSARRDQVLFAIIFEACLLALPILALVVLCLTVG